MSKNIKRPDSKIRFNFAVNLNINKLEGEPRLVLCNEIVIKKFMHDHR